MKTKLVYLLAGILVVATIFFILPSPATEKILQKKATKLYWFIPDGMRADPDLFNIYKWADEGKLPNIKKMMDNGAYGFSKPVFPSHTPTNFATLLTGAYPAVHGVADGPMHIEGFPLDKPSIAGFSSTAKKVSPIWTVLENAGKKVVLLSIPGSTPPELQKGITIRGRWGGWGFDTYAINFEPKEKLEERKSAGRGFRLFFLGQKLTQFVDKKPPSPEGDLLSFSPPFQANLDAYGTAIHAYIFDSTNDTKVNYGKIRFSLNSSNSIVLSEGEWSKWIQIKLKYQNIDVDSDMKIKIIKLSDDGTFRIRLFFNNINRFLTDPPEVAEDLTEGVGPMVDFVDNWPAQLIYEPEDKQTFLEEANMSLEWHRNAIPFIYNKYNPDVVIQDTYTPNQMLESRWWHRYIEGGKDYSPENASLAWNDILWMYKKLDDIIGEAMKNADENTIIVLSSDHGIAPLKKTIKLNNIFAKKGWLKFSIDNATGEPLIDWNNTKVVYLKMAYIYVNPNGLGGKWNRSSGAEYEKLRDEVIDALKNLQDENSTKPVKNSIKWEDAAKFFELPSDRIGDIVIEAEIGYAWDEEMSSSMEIFSDPLTSGYKQTIDPNEKAVWTPFVIMGPGVKKGYRISEPINHVDQMPTLLNLLGVNIPNYVQGRVLNEISVSG